MVLPDQVQQPVDERRPPRLADHLRAEHRVAELARQPGCERLATVDREREHVGDLVAPDVVALELPHLVGTDEMQAELALRDPSLASTSRASSTAASSSTFMPLRFDTST